jgi:hypothetical protein
MADNSAAAPAAKSFTVHPVEPSKDVRSAPAPNSAQGWIGVTTKYLGRGEAVVTAVVAGSPTALRGVGQHPARMLYERVPLFTLGMLADGPD